MEHDTRAERRQAELAAREAAAIGGDRPADREGDDPARRPVNEAGGGEAEGFEQAEEMLIERASHADQQAAHAVLRDQGAEEELDGRVDGEPDRERSSEREDEESPPEQ